MGIIKVLPKNSRQKSSFVPTDSSTVSPALGHEGVKQNGMFQIRFGILGLICRPPAHGSLSIHCDLSENGERRIVAAVCRRMLRQICVRFLHSPSISPFQPVFHSFSFKKWFLSVSSFHLFLYFCLNPRQISSAKRDEVNEGFKILTVEESRRFGCLKWK